MKFQIMHECRGRLRIHTIPKGISMLQADCLEAYLQQLEGVTRAVVHDRTGCAIIEYGCERKALLCAISCFPLRKATESSAPSTRSGRELNRIYEEKLLGKVAFKLFRRLFFPVPLNVAYTLCASVPYLVKGVRSLRRGHLQVEALDALTLGISMVRRDFNTAASVMFLLGLGGLLEEWTRKKSVEDLARSMALNVDRVWLKTESGEVLVPLETIRPGDYLSLRMGCVVPMDGVIEDGEIMVNQASMTGESAPVVKRLGTTIYAGTVIVEGNCIFRVEQRLGDSRYDRIVSMIESSERMKSTAENKAFRLADRLVPYTLCASVLTWILTGNVTRALSVLMVDFSCALKLAMPLSVLSAMREAGRYHITVKGGKFLEAIANSDTVVFDKTGTLTHACPRVDRVIPFRGGDSDEMLRLAACLEEHFPHSMANAVVQAAMEKGLKHEEMHSQVEYLVAHGISSMVEGQKVVIGSAHFVFEDEGCVVPDGEREAFDALPLHCSHLYLAVGGVLSAVICIADPLRQEARTVIGALKELGVSHTVMLTGDSKRTAAAVAEVIGVDEYQAEVLPEDKARFVENMRAQGHVVMMIGDGINDSPALSAADVGVAISDGAAIAREISDITIAADDLTQLIVLRRIAQAMAVRVRNNYRFICGFNSGLILLSVAGLLAPASSATLHNLSTLAVSVHSMTDLLKEEAHCRDDRLCLE